jgi:hypothetical protein
MSEVPWTGGDLFTNLGWRCPGCRRCYSPQVLICFKCPEVGQQTVATEAREPGNWTSSFAVEQEEGDDGTAI